jgi:hypothetical protein
MCYVENRRRSERESKRHENCTEVAAFLSRSAKKRVRERFPKLGIPAVPKRKHIKTDPTLKACLPITVNDDSRNDLQN